jgi:hypothetical protein
MQRLRGPVHRIGGQCRDAAAASDNDVAHEVAGESTAVSVDADAVAAFSVHAHSGGSTAGHTVATDVIEAKNAEVELELPNTPFPYASVPVLMPATPAPEVLVPSSACDFVELVCP